MPRPSPDRRAAGKYRYAIEQGAEDAAEANAETAAENDPDVGPADAAGIQNETGTGRGNEVMRDAGMSDIIASE